MNQSPECPVWTLPAGSLLHIGGMPYFTKEPTLVEGYGDPAERLKPVKLTGPEESESPASFAAGALNDLPMPKGVNNVDVVD